MYKYMAKIYTLRYLGIVNKFHFVLVHISLHIDAEHCKIM